MRLAAEFPSEGVRSGTSLSLSLSLFLSTVGLIMQKRRVH
jgi:hypothetical protein